MQAAWTYQSPKTLLPPPSAEAQKRIKALPVDVATGNRASPGAGAFMEYFRLDDRGRPYETQHSLVDRRHALTAQGEPRETRASAAEDRGPATGRRTGSRFNFFGLVQ